MQLTKHYLELRILPLCPSPNAGFAGMLAHPVDLVLRMEALPLFTELQALSNTTMTMHALTVASGKARGVTGQEQEDKGVRYHKGSRGNGGRPR